MDRKNFLESGEGSFEKNLKFVKNEFEESLNQYIKDAKDNAGIAAKPDVKLVNPIPGFCIKSFKVNTNEKYFINICQTDEIPEPADINENELHKILNSEEPSAFRVPMSISEQRTALDKSNNVVDVVDIAINPKFFNKLLKSRLFKDFFIALIIEALSDKYNIQIRNDKTIILNNRKFIGTLVQHCVRNNDIKAVMDSYQESHAALESALRTRRTGLVQEIDDKDANILKKQSEKLKRKDSSSKIKREISQAGSELPEYKLRAKVEGEKVEEVQAEFYLPKCINGAEINLEIGEDRILLESMRHGYLFDKFLNHTLKQEAATAIFDKTNKMLQVRIPVHPVQ